MSTSKVAKAEAVKIDPVWEAVRKEAEAVVQNEPLMSSFIYSTILNHSSLEAAVIHRISERLHNRDFSGDLVRQSFETMQKEWPEWAEILRIDIAAVYDRDPACERLIDPILYFKGFHAIQTHRLAHKVHSPQDVSYYPSLCMLHQQFLPSVLFTP